MIIETTPTHILCLALCIWSGQTVLLLTSRHAQWSGPARNWWTQFRLTQEMAFFLLHMLSKMIPNVVVVLQHDDRDIRIVADQLMESWQQIYLEAGGQPGSFSANAHKTARQQQQLNPARTHQPQESSFPQHFTQSSDDEDQHYPYALRQPTSPNQLAAVACPKQPGVQVQDVHAPGPSTQSSRRPVPENQHVPQHHKWKFSKDPARPPLRTVQPDGLSSHDTPKPQRKRVKSGTRRFAAQPFQANPAPDNKGTASSPHQNDSKGAVKSKRSYPAHSLKEVLSPASLQQHAILTSVVPGEGVFLSQLQHDWHPDPSLPA